MSELFDKKAVAYVRKHYPGHNPVQGTVTFQTDFGGGYDGGDLEADIDVSWTEVFRHYTATGRELPSSTSIVRRNVAGKAFDYDLNGLITEILEIQPFEHAALCRSRITGESEDRCDCREESDAG